MPIIKSAKKRVRVTRKATVRNAKTRRNLRSAVKSFQKILAGDKKKALELQRKAQSELGKAGKKHVLHKNKVARKQRQLAHAAKAAGIKIEKKGTSAANKTAPVAKKPAAKKPATKKTSAKK